ncbi:MAG: hypothetical protein HYT73_03610 [Candidatus Aenigmarchaeota archaeon]|nr:hypothetical protein [Candidatus Aenigmarchaeota archaeon]
MKKRRFLKSTEDLKREFMRILLETQTSISLYILEDVRTEYVLPEAGTDGYARDFLQHCGDLWEGYSYPVMIYNTLDILFPGISHRTKMAAAIGVSDLFIAAYESGLLGDKSPDYADIPAAAAGSMLYMGVNAAGRYMTRRFRRPETLL